MVVRGLFTILPPGEILLIFSACILIRQLLRLMPPAIPAPIPPPPPVVQPFALSSAVPPPVTAFAGPSPPVPGNVSTRRTVSATAVRKKAKPRHGFPEVTNHGFGPVQAPPTSEKVGVLFWPHCVSRRLSLDKVFTHLSCRQRKYTTLKSTLLSCTR